MAYQAAHILEGSDFEEVVYDPDTMRLYDDHQWFINFYLPSCVHCKNLVPVWEELTSQPTLNLTYAVVDCSKPENQPVCLQFHVRAYPTLMLLRDDAFYKFKG